MSVGLNENCSALAATGFEVKHLVRECLIPFPYLWASIDKALLVDRYLIMLYTIRSWWVLAQTHTFRSTSLTILILHSPVGEWLQCLSVYEVYQ